MKSGFQLAQQQAKAYEAQSGVFMGPSARLIVESLQLRDSDVVLDLACGTGLIARHAYPMVQPDGKVYGADVNAGMLAVAESLADSGIEWVEAPAHNMAFADDTFTHVACQQGFQFFPDTEAAAREVHRMLRPGGTLAATIWATPGRNPYIETQLALLAELDDTIRNSAVAAAPIAADDLLRGIASKAGFSDIDVSSLEHSVEVGNLRRFFIDQTTSTPWAPVIAKLSTSEQNQLADEFVTRLDNYAAIAGHRLPFCSHMLLCHK